MPNHVMNTLTIRPSTAETWCKLLKHISPKNDITALTNGGECDFDFNQIIPMPETLDITSGGKMHSMMYQALIAVKNGELESKYSAEELSDAYAKLANIGFPTDCVSKREAEKIEKHGFRNVLKADVNEWTVTGCARNNTPGIKIPAYEAACVEQCSDITQAYLKVGLTYIENLIEHGALTWYEWRNEHWGTKWSAYDCYLSSPNNCFNEATSLSFKTAWCSPDTICETLSKQLPDIEFTVKYADENIGYNFGETVYRNGKATENELSEVTDRESAVCYACSIWGCDPEPYLDNKK